jgi:hypothetical protein
LEKTRISGVKGLGSGTYLQQYIGCKDHSPGVRVGFQFQITFWKTKSASAVSSPGQKPWKSLSGDWRSGELAGMLTVLSNCRCESVST